jgi:hypothetical protein
LPILVGCTSYEPHLSTGAGGGGGAGGADGVAALRQVVQDRFTVETELDNALAAINTADEADKAADKIRGLYERVTAAITAELAVRRHAIPEDEGTVDGTFKAKVSGVEASIGQKADDFSRRFPAAKKFNDVTANGKTAMEAAQKPAGQSGDVKIEATPAQGGTWAMWILILFVMAACAGFLFQDGIWGNCLRLVNVLFAGLLTMNFYELVADFLTKPGDYWSALKYEDMHMFTPFFDFLAFWLCFIFFAAFMIGITDAVSKVRVRFLQVADRAGGIALSLIIGWVMSGIVLTSLHLAPLAEYPFLGCFQPQSSMFLGFLAPDREWLGFTRYQSKYGYSRSYEASQFPDSGDRNFIDKHHKRRIEIERYVRGNAEHSAKVNPQFIHKTDSNPAPAPPPGR